MNLTEALSLFGALTGATMLSTLAIAQGLHPGLVMLAIPVGAAAGVVGGPLAFAAAIGPCVAIAYVLDGYREYETDRALSIHFGHFRSKDREWLWEDVQQHLRAGQIVRGRVATRLDGDLYVDVGLGFPARLRGWNAAHRFDFESAWGGEPVEARVLGIDGERRLVELTQRPDQPILR